VLKLIYHTAVFGPIDLEYDRPVIRVGSSQKNDLVLPHSSVEPFHCLLVFRGEKVLCLPPRQDVPSPAELRWLTGPEFGAGDTINIGDLMFSLAPSSRTVALPDIHSPDPSTESWPDVPACNPQENTEARHLCPHCRITIPDTEVKRVGLVGHTKIMLCPKCSRRLEP
jgi:hypothetical protein